MSRLKKNASDMEKQYFVMCEAVAYDVINNTKNDADPYEIAEDIAKQAIEAVGGQEFLSDFEKTVRDYFKEKGLAMSYETLASDIAKYF
jgi:hypothetical protein